MDKIEKIRAEIAEIERRMKEGYSSGDKDVDSVARGVCAGILSFLDTLSEEPATKGYDEAYLNEKIAKASKTWEGVDVDKYMDEVRGREPDKSLVEEVKRYYSDNFAYISGDQPTLSILTNVARHFAEWQKGQFEKNRLAHCDALSKEDYDRETDFAMEIIEKEHRQPTFSDAINYGMRLQKEQDLAEMAQSKSPLSVAYANRCFENGKQAMKEQMMKIITKDDNLEEAGVQYVETYFRDNIDWTPDVIKSCLEEAFISGGEYVFKQIKYE